MGARKAGSRAASRSAVTDRSPQTWIKGPSLEQAFDPQNNSLNAWRLVLATGVIVWHSWPLTGRELNFAPLHQLLRDGFVDGFFAISGFLITWSWFRNPGLRDYIVARAVRILPGLWVCLIIIAFVIAPISVALQGGSAAALLRSGAPLDYVLANSAVLVQQPGIAGTPLGVPWPGEWDSSLWTLFWEALCYIAIAGLGVTGLLRRRWVVPILFAMAVVWSTRVPVLNALAEQPPDKRPPLDASAVALFMEQAASRFSVMFLAGVLLYQFRRAIPARWSIVGASTAILLAATLLPNYRWIAAIPLAYVLIVSGALIRHKRLRLRTDLSYGMYIYAFPVQQLLIVGGLASLNLFVFALIAALATVPLAASSWFLVEKPAMSLKSRMKHSRKNGDIRDKSEASVLE